MSECQNFGGFIRPDGYGQLRVNGKTVRAHRHAYECAFGPIPEGMCVCHSCDNRTCITPDHLFLGTQRDNIRDAIQKGRFAPVIDNLKHDFSGEKHGNAKLTKEQVELIREKRKSGMRLRELADEFPVGITQLHRICKMERWRIGDGNDSKVIP